MGKYKIEIKWALLFMGMTLVWMMLERVTGFHDQHIDKHAIFTNLYAIPAILIYVFALRDKRDNYYDGSMTYLDGFFCGIIITIIVTLFSPLTQTLTLFIISPEYFNNIIDHVVSIGKMTREEAQAYFSLANYIKQSLIATPIMGIITSAAVALFVKKKRENRN